MAFSAVIDEIKDIENNRLDRNRRSFPARSIMPDVIDIANKIENYARANSSSGTLFVPFGENHDMPSHVLTLPGVLEVLKRKGFRVAHGREQPYDLTLNAFFTEGSLSADYYDKLSRKEYLSTVMKVLSCDANGKLTAEIVRTNVSQFARRANSILYNYQAVSNISLSYNDVAYYKNSDKINYNDVLTYRVLRKLYAKEPLSDRYESSEGMHVRNVFMAQRARSHAKFAKADIYIQNCGSGHVFGREGHPYQHSLTVCIEALGGKSFPVILDSGGEYVKNSLSAESTKRLDNGHGIIKNDLPNDSFVYMELADPQVKWLAEREDEYISKLVDADYREMVLRNVGTLPQDMTEACGNSFHWKEELEVAIRERSIAHPTRGFLP